MRAMIGKILKKLGLGHATFRLVAPVYSAKYKRTAAGSPEKAMTLLQETSPDTGSSCCIPPRPLPEAAGAELDIIVPAYNTEQYISRCVSSVLEQETKYRFRLIVVDDGSTDDTGAILDSFPGLTVIHQENRGFSGARNRGLELADAEYLMFLDSDDVLCPGAIEALMSAARENGADIAEGGYVEVDMEGKLLRRHRRAAGIGPATDCFGYPWGKVMKRALFEKLAFPKDYWYEDSVMRQVVYPLVLTGGGKSVGVDQDVVLYTQNRSGITKMSKGKSKSLDSLYITLRLFEDRKQLGLPLTKEYYDYLLGMAVQTYSRTHRQSQAVQQAVFTVYAGFLQRNFPDRHTGNRRLACLEKALRTGDYGSYLAYCKLH